MNFDGPYMYYSKIPLPQDAQKSSSSKAAGESKPEEVQTALRVDRSPLQWILANGKSPPALPISENLIGYVEDFDEPRTKRGKRRVLARRGRAGGRTTFSASC